MDMESTFLAGGTAYLWTGPGFPKAPTATAAYTIKVSEDLSCF